MTIERQTLTELARRTAMLDAIGYAATQIVAAVDWRAGIQELLDRLGHATEVSRVTLFEVHKDAAGKPVQSCRYDWAEPGLASISNDPRYQSMRLTDDERPDELEEWSKRRQRGEVVQATLREVTGYTREVFLEHGTLSFASVPIMLDGAWWGFLGFDDCKLERVWSPLEIDILKTAAALIAGAISRARAGEQLRLSEERYAMAARGANDGLFDWDMVSGIAYFSPRLHEILGVRDGALGDDIKALYAQFLPEDTKKLQAVLMRRFTRGRHKFDVECRAASPNTHGEPRWLALRGLIVYRDGRPRRIVGALRDISDRKAAEARLQENEARARAVQLAALDAIITIDHEGRIIEFNPAAEKIFGHFRSDVIDRPVADLIIPPEKRDAHRAGVHRFAYTGESQMLGRRVETEAITADGRRIPIEMAVTDIALGDRRLFTGFLRDITERHEFQRQLTEAERKRASLARYFSPNMVDDMMRSGRDLMARSQIITVLFADMVGFTGLTATLPSIEVIALLREYLAMFEEAVFAHGGTLDKYLGDGVMATFGTPRPGPRDATNAIACARAMAEKIVAWNMARIAEGQTPLRIGIGLHHGEVVLGDIGSERRMELAVIGDTVNVASRIQDMTRSLDIAILASDAVIQAVRSEGGEEMISEFRDAGIHALRGRQGMVRLWGRRAEP
ncbi:MAG: adenylate cyclase [Rhodospirillaceae bacterium]|nr:adenylate cyclase [Rhodospirillaceae bacterium]